MNRDCLVVGIFMGALMCSLLMLLWGKPKVCEVRVGRDNVTHVYVGEYKE